MPELPEVEITRRLIEPLLVGRKIARLAPTEDSYFFVTPGRVLRRRLRGRSVSELSRLGKYLLADLDRLIVLRPDSVSCVDASALNAEPIEVPLDPLTPVHHLAELPEGESLGGTELAERLRLAGCTLASAQLLGLAEASHELAVEYAKGRNQFGRAIGSFQAVKHILADMFVRLEVARAAVYAAGATLADPGVGDAARAAGSAKLVAGEAALQNARACIQVHGGRGYTWEVPVHSYLKRSWVLASVFGGAEEHAEALARCVELDARAPGTSL